MPRTVNEGFNDFLSNLRATAAESDAAKSHRASIKRCLENNFGLEDYFRAGSFGNGTNISGYSDVDYIARIPTKSLKQDSDKTLRCVRDALDYTFPGTGVRVDCPAVLVPFGKYASEKTEVIPADYVKDQGGYKVYDIADGNGGWIKTSPSAHNAYVREINDKHGGKVKPLIRFVKAWKYFRNVAISSFYLEMRVAQYADKEETIVYSYDVCGMLRYLDSIGLASMQDPLGIAGYIQPCSTTLKLEDSKSKLSTALTRAVKAIEAEKEDKISDAFDYWRLLYGDRFPTYYR